MILAAIMMFNFDFSGTAIGSTIYDAASQIYITEQRSPDYLNFNNLAILIYPDGTMDGTDPRLTPFDYHSGRVVEKFITRNVELTRLPIGSGIAIGFGTFFSLDEHGRHRKIDLFDSQLIPCVKVTPRDICFFGSSVKVGDQDIILAGGLTGRYLFQWNNGAYGPISGSLTALTVEDFDNESKYLPLGPDRYVIIQDTGAKSADVLAPAGRTTIGFPWPEGSLAFSFTRAKVIGPSVYVAGASTVGTTRISTVFRIEHGEAGTTITDLAPKIIDYPGNVNWLGIDAEGFAYGYRPGTSQVAGYNLNSGELYELGLCPQSGPGGLSRISMHDELAEPGVWIYCGSKILGLRGGRVISDTTFRSEVSSAHILSFVGDIFSGLVSYSDGTKERFDHGEKTAVQSKHVLPTQFIVDDLYWEDGQRQCRRHSSMVECLDRGSWTEAASPIGTPVDIIESLNYTWAIVPVQGSTQVFRRERRLSDPWQRVAEIPVTLQPQFVKFIPTGMEDEVAIFISGDGIYHLGKLSALTRLPVDISQIVAGFRPALSDQGWLYTICPAAVLVPNIQENFDICAFDPAGNRHPMGKIIKAGALVNSVTNGFLPLRRGAILDLQGGNPEIGQPTHEPLVVYHDRAIPLATMFGEFRNQSSHPWKLKIHAKIDGTVLLEKLDETQVFNDPVYSRTYEFSGRQLALLEKIERDVNSFEDTQFGGGMPSRWSRAGQIWQGLDGLWRGTITIPRQVHLGATPIQAARNQGVRVNASTSGTATAAEGILANEAGLWFCDHSLAPAVGPDVWRIRRHPGCEHHGFSGLPRQVRSADTTTLLVLSGSRLVKYDRLSRQATELANDVASEFFDLRAGRLFFADSRHLRTVTLSSGEELSRSDLPSGVSGESVVFVNDQVLCASAGLYERRAGEDPWRFVAASCNAASPSANAGPDGETYAAAGDKLYFCRREGCAEVAALPEPRSTKLALDNAGGRLMLASGKQLFSLEGQTFLPCSMRWGHGELPKAAITGMSEGLAWTDGGGAFLPRCDGSATTFRIE
jgi:hypothetical protein